MSNSEALLCAKSGFAPSHDERTEITRCLLALHGFTYREYSFTEPRWERAEIARDGSQFTRRLRERVTNMGLMCWQHEVETVFNGSIIYVENIPLNNWMTASDVKHWLEGFHV